MGKPPDNSGNPNRAAPKPKGKLVASNAALTTPKKVNPRADPDLLTFKWCAIDGNVHVKTISRWVKLGYLTDWRPHPRSRTRRIKRDVWIAFKQRRM